MPSGQAKDPPASVPHYPTSSTIPHNPIASAISTYIPNPTCPVIPADATLVLPAKACPRGSGGGNPLFGWEVVGPGLTRPRPRRRGR